jgi:putative hemolysin
VNIATRAAVVVLLILGNAIFVAAEYALVTARRSRLEEKAEKGSRSAAAAVKLLDHPVRLISTIQIAITLFGIALGAVGEPLIAELIPGLPRSVTYVISFVVLTYVAAAFGELVPKAIALQKAEGIASALAIPLNTLTRILTPINVVMQWTATAVLKLFGVKPAPAGMVAYTREDILQSVAAAEDVGEIEQAEEEMLFKVFDFAGKEVHEVMVPKPQINAIPANLSPDEVLAAVVDLPNTRYPVYGESLDDIRGVLHVRDLFKAVNAGGPVQVEIKMLLRPAFIVPETKDLAALLADFRRTKQHLAIVVDEYGATQGLVTLEDLLEEIVGEIEDEFDLPDEQVEQIDDTHVQIAGTFTVDDFNETFGTDLEHEDYNTVAGLVFHELGRQPEVGDVVAMPGATFTIVTVDGNRINRLEVELHPQDEDASDDDDDSDRD